MSHLLVYHVLWLCGYDALWIENSVIEAFSYIWELRPLLSIIMVEDGGGKDLESDWLAVWLRWIDGGVLASVFDFDVLTMRIREHRGPNERCCTRFMDVGTIDRLRRVTW